MWFKEFFMNSVIAFFDALPTIAGGAYEGSIVYGIIGIPLLVIFFIGCVKILSKAMDWLPTVIGRLKQKLKRR